MAAERVIAVDFGTSTSVVRVKRYLNGQPVGDRLETKPVSFNMGATMVPTLVQKLKATGESVYFGHEAEIAHKNTETFRNFKVDIEHLDPALRERARALTAEFFGFLARTYRTQSDGGHLGENDDRERTIISYPVKWTEETKNFMIKTAQDAGFPNVEGMDEAQAAIHAVTAQNADQLQSKGYFRSGVPTNILLIDMGAGTTDLVLCRYTPGDHPKTDVLATWPREEGALFGGQEMDALLKDCICAAVPEESAGIVRKKIGTDKFKAWKETVVSPALAKGESVDYFSALDDLLGLLDVDADYLVDRPSLERFAAGYLRGLPELVSGALDAAGMTGDQVELVILTGGHSQWYFVREMLSGNLGQPGDMGLAKIQANPERIISISLPQETVALGLAYQGLELMQSPDILPNQISEVDVSLENADNAQKSIASISAFVTGILKRMEIDAQVDVCHLAEENYKVIVSGKNLSALRENSGETLKSIQFLTDMSINRELKKENRFHIIYELKDSSNISQEDLIEVIEPQSEKPDVTPESEFELSSIGNCYGIKKYNGNRAHVVIPAEIRGLKVVAIGISAFRFNKELQTVVIPPTVKTIKNLAFDSCPCLRKVVAHREIEVIERAAFSDCKNLIDVDFDMGDCPPGIVKFPPSLKSIGETAFSLSHGTILPKCKCYLKEVWLSKGTEIKGVERSWGWDRKTFTEDQCAIFYYDNRDNG